MQPKLWIFLGALLGGLGVIAGAFGAHGLEGRLPTEQLETFEVAVRYQMYHALALVLVGLLGAQRRAALLSWSGASFMAGMLIFSGLLYAWVFTGIKTFAMIVPLGGLLLIAGWGLLAAYGLRRES